jgi:hydroxyisourate hydrolase
MVKRRLLLILALLVAGLPSLAQTGAQANGAINTNVYDAAGGRYAEGMKIELFEVKGEALRLLSAATVGANGRAELIEGRSLAVGQYELRFQLADYYRKRSVATGDPPYLDYVPVRFSVDAAEGHYHVPIICTPWSYSTYRGS